MISVNIQPDVFNPTYLPFLRCPARTQIYYGGSGSGKSVFLAQRAVYDLLGGGRNYLICRAVGATLRKSVFNEVRKIIVQWGLSELFTINRSLGLITCVNGYQAMFTGLDDSEKVKSMTPAKGAITDIWVEEATETRPDDLKQLYKRQRGGDASTAKRLTLSFNPILKTHHIYQTYFAPIGWADSQTEHKTDQLTILKTWYIHNEFLTEHDVADLLAEVDDYYREVYTYGNWGVLGDLIFKNWRVEDLSGMREQFTSRRHGLDFGFSSDPAALVQTHYDRKNKRIYIYGELYERELTNDVLAAEVRAAVGGDYVVCDSAEPKSIKEIQLQGVNAAGAKKGKDSVSHGIQWLQQQEIIIDKSCINTINEFNLYQWRKDRDGNSLREPVDRNNHAIDALRYAYESESARMGAFL